MFLSKNITEDILETFPNTITENHEKTHQIDKKIKFDMDKIRRKFPENFFKWLLLSIIFILYLIILNKSNICELTVSFKCNLYFMHEYTMIFQKLFPVLINDMIFPFIFPLEFSLTLLNRQSTSQFIKMEAYLLLLYYFRQISYSIWRKCQLFYLDKRLEDYFDYKYNDLYKI